MNINERIDWRYMFADTRARVYLLWAVLATGGFVATHFNQNKKINLVWLIIAAIGLGYMLKVMPLRIKKLRLIYLSWLIPLSFGLAVSILAFGWPPLYNLISYLGGFWLVVLAAGYFFTGLVDPPATWYFAAAGLNALAALAILTFSWAVVPQFLIAAVVTAWSMLSLWILRVD